MDQEDQGQSIFSSEQLTSQFPVETRSLVFKEGFEVTPQSEITLSLIHWFRIKLECREWETGSWIEVSMDQSENAFTVEWVESFGGSREVFDYYIVKSEHEVLCRLLKYWIIIKRENLT